MADKRDWTPEQADAIKTRDRTLLVSAAAGSGKTATLTERIIRSLLDEKNPENINEMLVVTFTKAAVAELRERIGKAIKDAIKENPESERLRSQLALLPSAKIQTIDSFCVDILRKNCDKVGVSPLFRIPDEAESQLLARLTMEKLIDAVFEGLYPEVATPEQLEELTDGLTSSKRMSDLAEVFLEIYRKVGSTEGGVDGLYSLVEEYTKPVSDSRPIRYAMDRVRDMAEHYIHHLERIIPEIDPTHPRCDSFYDMCRADLAFLRALKDAEGYTAMREVLFGNMQAAKARRVKTANEQMLFSVSLREELDSDLLKLRDSHFFLTEEQLVSLYARLYSNLTVFVRFLSRFDRDFMEEKRRLGMCEFSDVTRYTYKCLYDGAPTDIARAEAARYSSIYIDEYQDVNAIQNRIFESISRADNRFMVGDIKQSIYVFRGAKPKVFAEMKNRFVDFKDSRPGDSAALFMSKNFRSERPILRFANEIFDSIFALAGESIGYRAEDRLEPGRGENPSAEYPEVHVLPKVGTTKEVMLEPRFVAKKISELLREGRLADGREIKPSDVAIILRYDKGRSNDFATALAELGVPAFVQGTKSFFLSEEVLLALCLLNSVDNPRKDIYLAGLMCSPLFGFTADELIRIKRGARADSLYGSLTEYTRKNPDYRHGAEFIATLSRYRRMAEGSSVDEVVARLYRETGLIALASEEGKKNLNLLYEHARSFEASSFKGLYNFLKYINDIISGEAKFDEKKEASDDRAVKIVTAHSSKGLEYPVVFLVNCAAAMIKHESRRLNYADGFALSMTLRTESGLSVLENPINNLVTDFTLRDEFEQELRVLYVALTRAKEKLFVVGTCPSVHQSKYIEKLEFLKENLTRYGVYKLYSYLETVLTTAHTTARTLWHEPASDDEERGGEIEETERGEVLAVDTDEAERLADVISERFAFRYPSELLTRLPEKLAVSYLYPTVLDGSEEPPLYEVMKNEGGVTIRPKRRILPRFATEEDPDESAKRGIATHLFMQFCDLEYFKNNGAVAELSRLVSHKYLSEEDAKLVRIKEIEAFRDSSLLSEMIGARKLYRELRFNLKFPASAFTENEEKRAAFSDKTVLVQGVIDCIIERQSGELILVDYKTDRLTAAELSDRALAHKRLTLAHASQLSYYRAAVEKMFGRAPVSVGIYSLHLGDTVEIEPPKM